MTVLGEVVSVEGTNLLNSARPIDIRNPAFSLEQLPNRNSLPYGDIYGLDDAALTVYRGTLRYAGFSEVRKRDAEGRKHASASYVALQE